MQIGARSKGIQCEKTKKMRVEERLKQDRVRGNVFDKGGNKKIEKYEIGRWEGMSLED